MYLINNKKEKDRILEIFTKAFSESSGILWITGKSDYKLNLILKLFIEEAYIKKGAFLTEDQNGAVLYFHLQNSKKSVLLILKKLLIFLFVIGLRKSLQVIKYKKTIDQIRPKNGWLGWLVATDETADGNAAAYEIKNEMFRIADETKEPIYVETTVPRVRALYRAAGYREYRSISHPYKKLTIWFMKRDPIKQYI